MKKYIGREKISAEPMTYGEAYRDGIIPPNVYVEELSEEAGYKIVGSDKAEGWLDKEYFEALYKEADTLLERMEIERSELAEKFNKLDNFVADSEDYKALCTTARAMFIAQRNAMGDYGKILNARISQMKGGGEDYHTQFSFGVAITLLENGFVLRREGWNGKGLVVFKQVPAHITSEIIPKMQSLPQAAKDFIMEGKGVIDYTSQCLIYNDTTGRADSWVPSISDVFAKDWELVVD